jgi:hypothetical protein
MDLSFRVPTGARGDRPVCKFAPRRFDETAHLECKVSPA